MPLSTAPHPRRKGRAPIRARSGVTRLIGNLSRLAAIQMRLTIAQLKLGARRLLLVGILIAGACVLTILGVIFLEMSAFQILNRYLDSRWVWLIFAGAHALLATLLIAQARSLMQQPLLPPSEPPPAAESERP